MQFYIAAIFLPIVAGLLRFSVAYGYEGKSRAIAGMQARQIAILLGATMALIVLFRLMAV